MAHGSIDRKSGKLYHKNRIKKKRGETPMAKEKRENRFENVYSQGTINLMEIWVDRETGVNYLYHAAGYSGGLTPLLDRDGKPIVSMVLNRE